MYRKVLPIISLLVAATYLASAVPGCSSRGAEITITSTEIEIQPNDVVRPVSHQLLPVTLDYLVHNSDAIVVGKVVSILPSQRGDCGEPPLIGPLIYTDVVIQPDRFFLGQTSVAYLAVRVTGGRIGNEVVISDVAPVITVGEEALLFLSRPTTWELTPTPKDIEPSNYYFIISVYDKWSRQGDKVSYPEIWANRDEAGKQVSLADLEKRIVSLRGG
jgi:hypothetical protein